MARKTKQEAQKTRETLLDVAMQVILTHGIARAKLADIAKEAGVTRGAIYWHFSNKSNLLNTIWQDLINENDFFFQVSAGTYEYDPIGYLVDQLFVFLKKNPEIARRQKIFYLFIQERMPITNECLFQFNQEQFFQQRLEDIKLLLECAINEKQLPDNADTSVCAATIVAYTDGMIPKYQEIKKYIESEIDDSFIVSGLMNMLNIENIKK